MDVTLNLVSGVCWEIIAKQSVRVDVETSPLLKVLLDAVHDDLSPVILEQDSHFYWKYADSPDAYLKIDDYFGFSAFVNLVPASGAELFLLIADADKFYADTEPFLRMLDLLELKRAKEAERTKYDLKSEADAIAELIEQCEAELETRRATPECPPKDAREIIEFALRNMPTGRCYTADICSGYSLIDCIRKGKTKIFIRHPQTLFCTEDAFQAKKHDIAAIIQSHWKGLVQRKKYLQMRESIIILQKYIRMYLAKTNANRRREAAAKIRSFIRGFITRHDAPNEDNRKFILFTKINWLRRLARNLPQNILARTWPPCPTICEEASRQLEVMYAANMSRRYRLALSPERKRQFELKVLAEKLFKDLKKSYLQSVPEPFQTQRLPEHALAAKKSYTANLNGDKEVYATSVMKYDRHGYKPRERIIIVTQNNLHVLECKGSAKPKHVLPLKRLKFVVTQGTDRLLLVRIPDDLLKKDKGDLILEIPHLIEAITMITDATKDPSLLSIIDTTTIEHHMNGKNGIIEIQHGDAEKIHKDKSGHLLIVASP